VGWRLFSGAVAVALHVLYGCDKCPPPRGRAGSASQQSADWRGDCRRPLYTGTNVCVCVCVCLSVCVCVCVHISSLCPYPCVW
jgi:hypothetical protein